MIEVDGKVYRNLQEQVLENQKDIKSLQDNTYNKEEIDDALEEKADVSDVYDKTTADATFQTIAGMNAYVPKTQYRYLHYIKIEGHNETNTWFFTIIFPNASSTAIENINDLLSYMAEDTEYPCFGGMSNGVSKEDFVSCNKTTLGTGIEFDYISQTGDTGNSDAVLASEVTYFKDYMITRTL